MSGVGPCSLRPMGSRNLTLRQLPKCHRRLGLNVMDYPLRLLQIPPAGIAAVPNPKESRPDRAN